MTNLLLKTKTELFKWLQQQLCNGEEREREREIETETERDTASDLGGEFWEYILLYIPSLVSIQSSPN